MSSDKHYEIVETALRSPSQRSRWNQAVSPAKAILSALKTRLARRLLSLAIWRFWHGERSANATAQLAVTAEIFDEEDLDATATWLAKPSAMYGLLVDEPAKTGTARSTLEAISRLPRPVKPLGATWFARQTQLDAELPRVVYEAIALDGPASLGGELLDAMLLQVGRVASRLSEPNAKHLLKAIWHLASAPANPYDRQSRRVSAQTALVRLLEVRPEIEPDFVRLLQGGTRESRLAGLDILAKVVRSTASSAPSRLTKTATPLGLTPEEWTRFCDVAEVSQRTAPQRRRNEGGPPSWRLRRLRTVAGVAAMCLLPASTVASAVAVTGNNADVSALPPMTSVPLEGAVALVALIATINVFTVQLSTTRLPGTVARVAGQPRALIGAYASALTLLGVTAYGPDPRPPIWAAAELVLATSALAWLAGALVRIFRRTDPAEACKFYVERNMHRWARAGRAWGAIQWRSMQLQNALDALPFVETGSSGVVGHDVVRISAQSRGMVLPKRSNTRKILLDPVFEKGGRLHLSQGMGVIAAAGSTIAFVQPPATLGVSNSLRRSLQGWLSPVPSRPFEEVSTQVISLASLSLRTAAEGDTRLGESIAEAAGRVLEVHLSSVHAERASRAGRLKATSERAMRPGDHMFPVTPVLRDLLEFLVTAGNSPDHVGSVADVLLRLSLGACNPDDQGPTILTGLLSDGVRGGGSIDRTADWLRRAGVSALEDGNTNTYGLVIDQLVRLIRSANQEDGPIRALTAATAAAIRLQPQLFDKSWEPILELAEVGPMQHMRQIMQIGAVSFETGAFPAALHCARWFEDPPRQVLLSRLTDLDNVAAEALMAKMGAVHLGDSGTGSLEAFRDFVKLVNT